MRQRGLALMELMLVVGLAAVVTTAAWVAWGPTSSGVIIEQESEHLVALDQAIQADYLVAQDRYQSLSAASTVTRSLAPVSWIQDGQLHSASLGGVDIHSIANGQGYRIRFTAVPHDLCVGLIQSNARWFTEVHVLNTLVYQHRSLNKSALVEGCSQSEEVSFDRF